MTFDVKRIPVKLLTNGKNVSVAFYPQTQEESDRLWDALMRMREAGHFEIDTSTPKRAEAEPARDQPASEPPPSGAGVSSEHAK